MAQIDQILRALAVLGLCSAQAACLGGPLEDDTNGEDVASSEEAVLTTNRLTMNRLTMNRLTMNGLSMGKLASSGSQLSPTALIETVEGRELLTYLIRCALPSGQSLSATYNGTKFTFPGNLGLTPEWLSGPLSQVGQRWMTACLLAHVNGYGIEVPISLRGELNALSTSTSERTQFSVQEAAFYGNIFVSPTNQEYGLHVCAGSTVQAQCDSGVVPYRPQRSCGSSTSCAVAFVGPCRDEENPELQTCENTSETFVEDCFPETMGENDWSGVVKYPEIITVYLAKADFNSLYVGCDPVP